MLKDAILKVKIFDGTELDKKLTRSTVKFENGLTVTLPNYLIHFEEKVIIPQFVADWIEECKNDDFHLFGAMECISSNQKKLDYWFREDDNMELFARAWLDGYTVEEEKRYIVSLKNGQPLVKSQLGSVLYFSQDLKAGNYKVTRKELEEAGIGEVFTSPLFEVEEVER